MGFFTKKTYPEIDKEKLEGYHFGDVGNTLTGFNCSSITSFTILQTATTMCWNSYGSYFTSKIKSIGVETIPEEKLKECDTCGSRKFIDNICIYCGNER